MDTVTVVYINLEQMESWLTKPTPQMLQTIKPNNDFRKNEEIYFSMLANVHCYHIIYRNNISYILVDLLRWRSDHLCFTFVRCMSMTDFSHNSRNKSIRIGQGSSN